MYVWPESMKKERVNFSAKRNLIKGSDASVGASGFLQIASDAPTEGYLFRHWEYSFRWKCFSQIINTVSSIMKKGTFAASKASSTGTKKSASSDGSFFFLVLSSSLFLGFLGWIRLHIHPLIVVYSKMPWMFFNPFHLCWIFFFLPRMKPKPLGVIMSLHKMIMPLLVAPKSTQTSRHQAFIATLVTLERCCEKRIMPFFQMEIQQSIAWKYFVTNVTLKDMGSFVV